MRFRACLIIGDRKGRVGMGVAKGADVAMSVEKAFRKAKKNMVTIPLLHETIPHIVDRKFAAAHVLLQARTKRYRVEVWRCSTRHSRTWWCTKRSVEGDGFQKQNQQRQGGH